MSSMIQRWRCFNIQNYWMRIHFPFNFFNRSIKSNIRYLIFEHITCVKFQFPVPVFLTNSKIQMSSERSRVEQLIECGVLIIMEADPSRSQEHRGNKQRYFHFIMTSPIKQYSCPGSQIKFHIHHPFHALCLLFNVNLKFKIWDHHQGHKIITLCRTLRRKKCILDRLQNVS